MRHVAILGGSGFIGGHIVDRLLSLDDPPFVTVLDRIKSHHPLAVSVVGDIGNPDVLKRALAGIDTVFHFAANADIAKAATDPGVDFWHGTYLTHCILEAMRKGGVKRIIYTSGSGVYGDCGETPVREDMPCRPVSPYGASKLASEALISAYAHMFDITACVFRFANVVGPRQTHGVGYDFIRKLRADPTRLEILGDGTQSKSYVHVQDVINAVLLANERSTERFDVFNVATPDWATVREIADTVIDCMGLFFKKPRLEFGDQARGWRGDVPVVRFDSSKIRQLGWVPQFSSASAITDSVRAMVKQCA
jgi:UDP-glucose 4-epimerase